LDLVGDLALLGKQILGNVVADRAGHAMHTALVSRILRDKTLWEEVTHGQGEEAPCLESHTQTAARSSA
jgi:UDP-3-O-[3-hydroxymyristoyl] N-acetylglucosamine deacetylase